MAKRPGKATRSTTPKEPTAFPLRAGAPSIELQQLLKAVGAADTGGGAKVAIQEGEVRVNGELELRRSRRLVAGDVVAHRGRWWKVVPGPPAPAG
jgi:ribosome-associated protein